MFARDLSQQTIDSLLSNKLFRDKLEPDIQKGVVFPAIRKGYIDFYHKGGRLFNYQKEFSTHKKYASVIKYDNDYISESDFPQKIQLIQDFAEGYSQIKENCGLYLGEEANGVSSVYHKHSFVKKDNDIVVLDIEVSFKSQNEDKKQDRIDLLLFNKKTQKLRFYEAKHYSNQELWSAAGTKPEVISQINRYEAQIALERENILKQYGLYVGIMNSLLGCNLPEPEEIDEKVVLFVFGFDRDQLQGRMKNLLLEDNSLEGIKYYFVGDVTRVDIKKMWEAVKCG